MLSSALLKRKTCLSITRVIEAEAICELLGEFMAYVAQSSEDVVVAVVDKTKCMCRITLRLYESVVFV